MIKIVLIFLSMLFLWVDPGFAAVTRQNTVPASITKGAGVTSVSWSHTVNSGSDLLLIVGIGIDDSSTFPTGVTYNGVAMTNIANQQVDPGNYGSSSAWKLVNPSTGSNTVEVTFSSSIWFGANSISFEGVDQTTPTANLDQSYSASSNGFNINVTTTSGDYAFAVIGANLNYTFTADAGSLEWEGNSFGGGSAASAAAFSQSASGSSTNLAWSFSGPNTNSYVAFAIQQKATVDIEQEGYRFRNDDGSETTATWSAAQDTAISQTLVTAMRLRVLVNTAIDPASAQYQLEYKRSTDTTYRKVESSSGSVAFAAAGASASGTTSLSVPYPSGISAGDLLVLAIANKYPSNAPSKPNGWTEPSNCQGSGGEGSSGADRGSVYSTIFLKEADGSESGNLSVTLSSANSAVGAILRYTKGTGKIWNYSCTYGSDNSGNSSSWSAAGQSSPDFTSGDMVVVASAVNTDAYTFSSEALSAAGITFGAETERIDAATTSGNDAALVVCDHAVSSGTATVTPTFTMTSSGSAANNPAGASSILRIRQLDAPIQLVASANIAASGENTTAQLTAPSGKTTADFVTGRMQDDENPADAVDITSNDYTELEWSLTSTSTASYGESYIFRVTASGTLFSTYTVTPRWNLSSGGGSSAVTSSAFITFD